MWFAKWFRGRTEDRHEDDEPARFTPPTLSEAPASKVRAVPEVKHVAAKPRKGFDPYNSGAFERKNAWERTNLR
jgi:hypothetical protein